MDQIIIQKQLNPPKAGALHLPYILQFSSCFLHSGVNLVTAPWLYNLVGTWSRWWCYVPEMEGDTSLHHLHMNLIT